MDAQLIQKVETALNGFETFKTDLAAKVDAKLDSYDEAKLNQIADAIGAAAEEQQKFNGKLKAIEDNQKSLEAAFNRAPVGKTDDAKALQAKRNSLFNEFARLPFSTTPKDFAEFVKDRVTDDAEYKALSVNADTNGGYLVMPEFAGIVQTKVYETSPIRQLASAMTVGTDSVDMILDNDEVSASWVGETQTRSTTNTPTLGKLTIPVNELQAMPVATQKMLDDGIIDVEAWLADKVSQYFARKEATAFVSGSGVMQPKGLLSYTAGTDITAQQIEQVVTGSASTFLYAGLVNLQAALKEEYQANAVFMIKRSSIANLMQITDGQSRPIFNLTFDKNTGVQSGIMGQSLYFANDIPAVASNALAMVYGDIRRAYQIVDRAGIRVLRDPYSSKPNVLFYTTKRVGGAVVNFEAVKIAKIST